MKPIGRIVTILSIVMIFSGCATTTKVDKTNFSSQPKEQDCEIVFYKDSNPSESYITLGKVESHIKKNLFFGGTVQLEDEAYTELRTQACDLGGDSVIINDYIETSAAEMSHVHIWATVLKIPK